MDPILILVVLGCIQPIFSAASWDYDGVTGPSTWSTNYPLCGGSSQSPVDCSIASAKYNTSLTAIVVSGYSATMTPQSVDNNGHTVTVRLAAGSSFQISGGLLDGTYALAQFHYHWGSDATKGSEHTIDSNMLPLELHLVHYNTKYPNVSVAADKSDGLAVLGVMFVVGSSDNTALNWYLDKLSSVLYKDNSTSITGAEPMEKLLPPQLGRYYRYKGSLTTPPCYESVTWSVFPDPLEISATQLAKFRTLFGTSETKQLVNNYRPVQALGSRTLYVSYDAAPRLEASLLTIATAVFMLVSRF